MLANNVSFDNQKEQSRILTLQNSQVIKIIFRKIYQVLKKKVFKILFKYLKYKNT